LVYAYAAWAQAPFGGSVLPPFPTGEIPPPIPGDPTSFRYSCPLRGNPWASLSWAGGYPPLPYPGGGIFPKADPKRGVVTVQVWWPDATAISLVRVTPDGVRTPVRGAYPLTTTTPTRHNWCANPSIEVGANGFVPADGNPNVNRLALSDAPDRTAYLRANNISAGSNGVTIPTALAGLPATALTVGLTLRTLAVAASVTVSMAWVDGLGGALATTTATLDANERTALVNRFVRIVKQLTVPTGAVNGSLKVVATGMPAGYVVDYDAITVETAATTGSYFDGATFAGGWTGTPDLSASALPPVLTIIDGECPLDTIVTYEASPVGLRGGLVVSDPLTLASTGHAWLTHPPALPVSLDLRAVPVLERGIEQGVFWPIGAQRAIVVSAPRRAPSGELEINTYSFAERDAFRDLFADGAPMLLRCPAEYGWPPAWLALGASTEDRGNRKAYQDYTLIRAPFVEVDAPAVLA
jgi:hypothetical protein